MFIYQFVIKVVGFVNYQAKIISLRKGKVNIMHKQNMQSIALKTVFYC